MENMTHDERRAIRRGLINDQLHYCHLAEAEKLASEIKWLVRFLETVNFGEELKTYA